MEIPSSPLLLINAIACSLVFIRLFFYRRRGASYSWLGSVCAWVLMVASAAITIQIIFNLYPTPNWAETLINAAFCLAVLVARGNVMQLARPKRGNLHG